MQQAITDQEAATDRRSHTRFWIPFGLGMLSAVLVIYVLTSVLGAGHIVSSKDWKYLRSLDSAYGKYYEVARMIENDPIAEAGPDDITDEDIREMVSRAGDPYAEYFTQEEYALFSRTFEGSYVGIGIGVVEEDGKIIIKTVYQNEPAYEAGIKEEDQIVKVDGKKPASVDDAVSMISGEAGTEVTITIRRDGKDKDYSMSRVKLEQKSVVSKELEESPGTGYIRILSFIKGTSKDFELAVRDLTSKGCDRFIIDLRNNGGGLTDESIKIADYLLPACKIMTEVTKDGKETVYNSKADSADIKCAVLVNENTASASEILTGAIKDNNGGVIIGSKTYGKGVTQVTHKFKDGSAVKITDRKYLRPNGDEVHGKGIRPDIEADEADALETALKELEQ